MILGEDGAPGLAARPQNYNGSSIVNNYAKQKFTIKDSEFVIPWDSKKYPAQDSLMPEWNRDHTLRSAIKYSVVWYYSELAKRVGESRMKEWVTKLGYGNKDISGGIGRFWLRSSLLISADEQIEFLNQSRRG